MTPRFSLQPSFAALQRILTSADWRAEEIQMDDLSTFSS